MEAKMNFEGEIKSELSESENYISEERNDEEMPDQFQNMDFHVKTEIKEEIIKEDLDQDLNLFEFVNLKNNFKIDDSDKLEDENNEKMSEQMVEKWKLHEKKIIKEEVKIREELDQDFNFVDINNLNNYPAIKKKEYKDISSDGPNVFEYIPTSNVNNAQAEGRDIKDKRCGQTKFSCDVGEKWFRQHTHLKDHKCIQRAEIRCAVCGKCFTQRGSLVLHNRIHTGEKPFGCDVCGKYFARSHSLVSHKRIHTGDKPFKCDACGKCFTNSDALVTHKRTHTGEKPFGCDVCGKYFAHSPSLMTHKRIHRGDKPNICDACGKSFTQLSHLEVHKLVHNGGRPHTCDVCKKSFRQHSHLKTHKRTHSKEKPYKCVACEKSFTQISHLKVHSLIHSGEKPHTCNVCNKSFRHYGNLKTHERIHSVK